jgi:CDP-glycerol glycerophosphotransferase (TagB/SpsB family)
MRSLLNAMKLFPTARLVVKPHPYDYIERYKAMVERDVSRDRIVFTEKDSLEVLSGAKFVITEDSTAGMEAMFFGKPLIHVHFGSAGTTIPFVELGCALRAYDERELIHAIGEVNSWVLGAGDDLLQAQRKFLLQFAGPCDGQASQRVVSLVEKLCAV